MKAELFKLKRKQMKIVNNLFRNGMILDVMLGWFVLCIEMIIDCILISFNFID